MTTTTPPIADSIDVLARRTRKPVTVRYEREPGGGEPNWHVSVGTLSYAGFDLPETLAYALICVPPRT